MKRSIFIISICFLGCMQLKAQYNTTKDVYFIGTTLPGDDVPNNQVGFYRTKGHEIFPGTLKEGYWFILNMPQARLSFHFMYRSYNHEELARQGRSRPENETRQEMKVMPRAALDTMEVYEASMFYTMEREPILRWVLKDVKTKDRVWTERIHIIDRNDFFEQDGVGMMKVYDVLMSGIPDLSQEFRE